MSTPCSALDISPLTGKIDPKLKKHCFCIRVYLSETDAGGFVYHAAYLTYAERARTEYLSLLGISHAHLMTHSVSPCFFVVREATISFIKSAHLGETLTIYTHVIKITKVRLVLEQEIYRAATLIAQLHITLACVKKSGHPIKIPSSVTSALEQSRCLEESL